MVRVAGAFSRSAKGLYRPYQIYRSAAGKSLVAKQPPLAGKSVETSQEAMLRLMPQIIAIAMTAESAAEVVPPAHPRGSERPRGRGRTSGRGSRGPRRS